MIYGSHFALRQFRKQGAGTLINIASVLGKIGSPYYASYSASKFAVVGLGQALNQEVRLNEAENIHISTISPMGADTPFWEHTANYSGRPPHPYPISAAEDVIDAIVDATTNPKKEVTVTIEREGIRIPPPNDARTTENVFGTTFQKVRMEDVPPAPNTAGSVSMCRWQAASA